MTQGIDSGKPAQAESTASDGMHGLTQAERRRIGLDRRARRLNGLEGKLTKRHMEAVRAIPTKFIDKTVKSLTGEASPRSAIAAKCEECVGYEDVRPRVGGCRSMTCPLHAYRPYQENP